MRADGGRGRGQERVEAGQRMVMWRYAEKRNRARHLDRMARRQPPQQIRACTEGLMALLCGDRGIRPGGIAE
jgi:hypothetical protein